MYCIDTRILPQLLGKYSQVYRLRAYMYIHKHICICTVLKFTYLYSYTCTHSYIQTAGVILGRLSIDTCDDYWTKHSDLVDAKSLSSVDSKTQRKNAKHINKLLSVEMLSIYWNNLVIGEFKLCIYIIVIIIIVIGIIIIITIIIIMIIINININIIVIVIIIIIIISLSLLSLSLSLSSSSPPSSLSPPSP